MYNITLITGKLSVMLYKFKNLEDYPLKELLEEYPELEKADFQAVFAYVTELVEEEKVYPVRVSA
mgnify:CR=1 FL=1